MDLTTKLTLALNAKGTKDLGGRTGTDPIVQNLVDNLANGTGTDRADQSLAGRRSVAAGGSDVLYLYGVMPDGLGDTVNFTRVKTLLISLLGKAESGYELYIGGHARGWETWATTGSAGVKEKVQGGGIHFRHQPGSVGFPVMYQTDDAIRIENVGANSMAYDFVILGEQGG